LKKRGALGAMECLVVEAPQQARTFSRGLQTLNFEGTEWLPWAPAVYQRKFMNRLPRQAGRLG
jgi:hypothetical protein